MGREEVKNLYVHFPFCRGKCTYCALHSRAGTSPAARAEYVQRLVKALGSLPAHGPFSTVYFGGGTPALCDLRPLFDVLETGPQCEFTVELHPLDATPDALKSLKAGGVNRISMGVQALDDATLADMRRGCTVSEAERAFGLVKSSFDNAGIDLITGYPPPEAGGRSWDDGFSRLWTRLETWGLRHCSVYSLILEDNSLLGRRLRNGAAKEYGLPADEVVMDRLSEISRFLKSLGLERYEISNYAAPGFECRHNLATWRGEDYIGLGEGAHGRIGRMRTRNWWGLGVEPPGTHPLPPECEEVSPEQDELERRIFSLRTRDGLDASGRPEWEPILGRFAAEGLLTPPRLNDRRPAYRLTERGAEVCDSILAELV